MHPKVSLIQDQFVKLLQIHLLGQTGEKGCPRLTDILTFLPQLQLASAALLQSKMFYVPFLLARGPDDDDQPNRRAPPTSPSSLSSSSPSSSHRAAS